MPKHKKTTVHVKGMHCASCDILITDKLGEVPGVKTVQANFKKQEAHIEYTGSLSFEEMNKRIEKYGYSVSKDYTSETNEPLSKRLIDALAIGSVILLAYFLLNGQNLLPDFNFSTELSFGAALFLGLVASTSTCMATSGALFLSTIGTMRKTNNIITDTLPALSFVLGRVISYTAFGYLAGYVGKSISVNQQFGSLLSLSVAFFMILFGLDMAKIVPLTSLGLFSFTKGIFRWLEAKLNSNPKKTAFLLGVSTYFLPCGFTQSMQVYVLGLADPVKSALTMFLFSLGTVPALLAIGTMTSFTKTKWYPWFIKTMGIVVFLVGTGYLLNFFSLRGLSINLLEQAHTNSKTNVTQEQTYQIAKMEVNSHGYVPNSFTVKKNKPVKWIVDGKNVIGCQAWMTAPQINVEQVIKLGENVIEFTPKEAGLIRFSCSMGMYNGQFTVID